MKRTDMEEIEIACECERCDGSGSTCDICDWNSQNGIVEPCRGRNHERDTVCHCFGGESTKSIWIPKAIIDEWKNKQDEKHIQK